MFTCAQLQAENDEDFVVSPLWNETRLCEKVLWDLSIYMELRFPDHTGGNRTQGHGEACPP